MRILSYCVTIAAAFALMAVPASAANTHCVTKSLSSSTGIYAGKTAGKVTATVKVYWCYNAKRVTSATVKTCRAASKTLTVLGTVCDTPFDDGSGGRTIYALVSLRNKHGKVGNFRCGVYVDQHGRIIRVPVAHIAG